VKQVRLEVVSKFIKKNFHECKPYAMKNCTYGFFGKKKSDFSFPKLCISTELVFQIMKLG
jgi:hypothetical protein